MITPAGWMNAGSAAFLRERLAAELTLEQLFLFGSYRLFATDDAAPTPTVESAILVATKAPAPKRHKLRVVALEDEGAARDRHALLEEMEKRAAGRAGRRGGIHVHDIAQASLVADRPWPVKFGAKDVATLVVAHLQGQLDEGRCEPLERSWKITMGVETGADEYTARIRKRLKPSVRERIAREGGEHGDPILQLPPGAEKGRPWVDHPDLLARAPEAEAILYGDIDEEDYVTYVRLTAVQPAG